MSGLWSQDLTISGNVKDASFDQPLPGVNVIVKNETRGTTTDFDGNFIMDNMSVGDIRALDEVIVVGYGTQTKKEITGAVAVVGAESIEELNPTRIEQALQGQVAGVQVTAESGSPGSASNIRIRGISTNGDNRPLILVDGNVIEDLSVINPSDIESINILKDATNFKANPCFECNRIWHHC
jgi:outer membrane receptor protein involved in Fe transport